MAHIDRRERTNAKGETVRSYRVRWRGPDGKERSKSFKRKGEADRFAATVSADLVRGQYVDPSAGKVLFEDYAKRWLAAQTFEEGTREQVESRLRTHAYPVLGKRFINEIQPSTIQGWLRTLEPLASTTRQVIFANVSTVFTAAVDDSLIVANPCRARSVRRPKVTRRKIVPWPRERVLRVRDELPAPYQLVVWLGAGLGLRQGEIFGLSPDDIDLSRGEVHICRQVKLLGGNKQIFGLPKGRKTRYVPLPDAVLEAINAHMTERPPVEVTLPWDRSDGPLTTVSLLIYSREKKSLGRTYFNMHIWKKALERAGVEPTRANGCHALRHFYASTALHEGESIKALSEYLGHSDPGFTLRTYTHLVEDSSQRTKRAVDAVFGHTTPDTDDETEAVEDSEADISDDLDDDDEDEDGRP
jgi:integrase